MLLQKKDVTNRESFPSTSTPPIQLAGDVQPVRGAFFFHEQIIKYTYPKSILVHVHKDIFTYFSFCILFICISRTRRESEAVQDVLCSGVVGKARPWQLIFLFGQENSILQRNDIRRLHTLVKHIGTPYIPVFCPPVRGQSALLNQTHHPQ